jgi:superfamily I DNA/RNA helicase
MTTTKFKPTAQQQAFTDALLTTKNHLALRARAGTGKTSAILLGVDAVAEARPGAEQLVCAFNKSIADEIAEKLAARGHSWKEDPTTGRRTPPRAQAATMHSLGFGLVKFAFRLMHKDIDDNKVRNIVDATRDGINEPEDRRIYEQYRSQIVALVKMAKQSGFGFFPDLPVSDTASWHRLADHYDINGLDDTAESEAVVAAAQRAYRDSLALTTVVDFDDMILFPLIKNLRVKFTKDYVYVDEYQDTNRSRQALARKFLGPRGRLIMVGDDRQAIYGFAGADAAAMERGIEEMDATVLPLSVTWRCPKAVVALAQTIVPDIEAAPTAIEGEVLHIAQSQVVDMGLPQPSIVPWYSGVQVDAIGPTDAILCRNTAPLVGLAYQLIRTGIPCKVEGRAIGEGLKALATRWKVGTIEKLRERLAVYKERERQKALAKGNESKAEEVEDRVQTVVEICDACNLAGKHDVADVVAFIDSLFADGATDVTVLATYHRSKGREWGRVFLLEHSARCPSRAARQEWQKEQEKNLAYVAYTRAQETLVFVD